MSPDPGVQPEKNQIPFDDAVVEGLALALVDEDFPHVERYFATIGQPAPSLRWSPSRDEIEDTQLRHLFDYWVALTPAGGLPHYSKIDPIDLGAALGIIMLLEPIDGGADFSYRVYGSTIAQMFGTDLNRRRVSDHPHRSMVQYFLGNYRACLRRRETLFSRHSPPEVVNVSQWDRLILPFFDDDERIARLLVGNVPGPLRRSPDYLINF